MRRWTLLLALPLTLAGAWRLHAAGDGARDLTARLELQIIEAAAAARPTVVCLRQPKSDTRSLDGASRVPSRSGGSGVVIDAEGFILTNDHVVDEGSAVVVTFSDGSTAPGAVWARDPRGDLAIVKVAAGRKLRAAELGDSRALRPGAPVLAIGNALGLALENGEPAASLGIISATHRFQGGERVYGDALQFDAAVNPGNSGGGLFDLDGRLLGITGRISIRGSISRSVGVGFAVPAHDIAAVLPKLMAGEDVVRGFLGLRFDRDAPGPGVRVASTVSGSPAELAGLRPGDIIKAIDGAPIAHSMRLLNALNSKLAGDEVRLTVRRALDDLEITARLDRRRDGEEE